MHQNNTQLTNVFSHKRYIHRNDLLIYFHLLARNRRHSPPTVGETHETTPKQGEYAGKKTLINKMITTVFSYLLFPLPLQPTCLIPSVAEDHVFLIDKVSLFLSLSFFCNCLLPVWYSNGLIGWFLLSLVISLCNRSCLLTFSYRLMYVVCLAFCVRTFFFSRYRRR